MKPPELRQLRRERLKISQEQLAAVLGVDRRTVGRWELGTVPIPPMLDLWTIIDLEKLAALAKNAAEPVGNRGKSVGNPGRKTRQKRRRRKK